MINKLTSKTTQESKKRDTDCMCMTDGCEVYS